MALAAESAGTGLPPDFAGVGWRKGWDSNPREAIHSCRLSTSRRAKAGRTIDDLLDEIAGL
jgi:hypothetical protein